MDGPCAAWRGAVAAPKAILNRPSQPALMPSSPVKSPNPRLTMRANWAWPSSPAGTMPANAMGCRRWRPRPPRRLGWSTSSSTSTTRLEIRPNGASKTNRDAPLRHQGLGLADRVLAVVEDAGRQDGVGTALLHPIGQVVEIAHTARGDHRHADGVAHGTRERQIEARLGAVAVHAGQQDLARAMLGHLHRPGHGIEAHVLAAAMAVDIPARSTGGELIADALLGVDGHHDALGTIAV